MANVLVLGGSVFVGKAIADKLIQDGNTVYVLNRGNHKTQGGAIQLTTNRNDKEAFFAALKGLEFDLVYDGSAYYPNQTRISMEALDGRVGHIIYISAVQQSIPADRTFL